MLPSLRESDSSRSLTEQQEQLHLETVRKIARGTPGAGARFTAALLPPPAEVPLKFPQREREREKRDLGPSRVCRTRRDQERAARARTQSRRVTDDTNPTTRSVLQLFHSSKSKAVLVLSRYGFYLI